MGNATKVALVALLILMVVVVARFVREDTAAPDPNGENVAGAKPSAAASKQAPESIARQRTSVNPGVRRVDPGARSPASPARPGESASIARQGNPASSTAGTAPAGSSPATSPPASAAAQASSPTPGPGAPSQSAPESRTASVATVVALDRPPVARTSSGDPLPAREPASTVGASDTQATRTGTPGTPAVSDTKAPSPGASPLVTTQLSKTEGGGDLTGGVSARPSQPAPASTRESGAPSFADLARAPESRSPADLARVPAPGGRASSSGEYPKSHQVVKGDTFWGLAEKYYGDGRLAPLIEKENPGVRMQPGKKLSIPEPPARPAAPPQPGPRSETREIAKARDEAPQASAGREIYVVQRGDTLGKIAMKFYGDAGKLELIEDANPHLKYQTLQAGAKIKIPPR